jgi:putative transposase
MVIKSNGKLREMMSEGLAIYDQALYYVRKSYFDTKESGKIKTLSFMELYNIMKEEECFKNSHLDYVVKTEMIRQVIKNWKSFIKATMVYKKNSSEFTGRPKMPGYLYKKKDYATVFIDSSRLRQGRTENEFRLPCTNIFISYPTWIDPDSIAMVSVQPYYGKVKINIVIDVEDEFEKMEPNFSAIGIDLGVCNLCAITANDKDLSYIVKGGPMKSTNQFYNKKKAEIQSMLMKCNRDQHKSHRLDSLTKKRNNKIKDYMHKTSRKIVDMCRENNISKIVIGHNDGWKQKVRIGKRNNQNFTQIPFNMLIEKIRYKAEMYGIEVVTVNESYTSKCDHLAFETMEHHDKYIGKRTKRGMFVSSTGKILNADINGAIGMLLKGDAISDVQVLRLRDRGDVVSPAVLETQPVKCFM